jgi:hypothetical protein
VVRRALAKDPDQRFQTARDLKAALIWAMEQPPAAVAKPNRRWHWIAALTLLVGALGGWGIWHFHQPPADDRVFRLQIAPPEGSRFVFSANSVGGIALSPDGRTAAYVTSGQRKTGLWIHPLDGAEARLIAGTVGAAYPFWSPDNKSVAFFTRRKLRRVDIAGGLPLAICDAADGRGGTWSSDGQILFGTIASGLFRVPASGGTSSRFHCEVLGGGDSGQYKPVKSQSGLGRKSEQFADEVSLADRIAFGQPSHSALPDHTHCLDTLQRPPRTLKRPIALGQPYSFLHRPMVLFNHVIKIFALT